MIFSPVMISQSGQVVFNIKNTGTTSATLSNAGIDDTKSPFALSGLPALPLTLSPGAMPRSQLHSLQAQSDLRPALYGWIQRSFS